MSRQWIDPPQGYLYGFPKIYDSATDGPVSAWLVKEGYPADVEIPYVRAWLAEEEQDEGG